MEKNTKATIWATVAVIMIVVAMVTYVRQRPKQLVTHKSTLAKTVTTALVQTTIATSTEAATIITEIVATSTPSSKIIPTRKPKPIRRTTPIPSPTNQLSYGDAVVTYGNHRIQFNPSCQATPSQMAVANPMTIMLDNRSSATQTITIAGQTYFINAYNYALVTLSSKTLPLTFFVNCNSQINTAEIIMQ